MSTNDHDAGPSNPARGRRGTPAASQHGNAPTLPELAAIVAAGRWALVKTVAAALAIGAAYYLLATPMYRSNVVVQVQPRADSLPGLGEVAPLLRSSGDAEAEMQIMRSRLVLGSAVDALGLAVEVAPLRLPILGEAVARYWKGPGIAPARLGLAQFAWGGERIRVASLAVPAHLTNRRLVLTALGEARYQLADPNGAVMLDGKVGATATSGAGDTRAEMLVSELEARPGTQFMVIARSRAETVEHLAADLRIEELGKKTGIVSLSLEGPVAVRTAAILDAIAATYARQMSDRISADAAQALAFFEQQLPKLKKALDRAESALKAFQLRNGTVNLSLQTEATLARAAELEKSLAEVEADQAALLRQVGELHPSVVALQERAKTLRAQRSEVDVRLRALPEREMKAARLARDVRIATEMYLLLLNKAQELQIVNARTFSNVHVVDPAVASEHPIRPRLAVTLALSLLLGTAAGVTLVLTRARLSVGLQDPADVESGTGLAVLVTVPHAKAQRVVRRAGAHGRMALLSTVDPGDVAVENLRALRTKVLTALSSATNNIVSIAGPTSGVGKSVICVNLAHLLAAAGRRVLVIDADLRRGAVHRHVGIERAPGLSEVLAGETKLEGAIRHTDMPGLDVLPTGRLPDTPAELLGLRSTGDVLRGAADRYDVVIVDTPSILSVTDCALVARHAGLNLLVLRAGEHPASEVTLAMDRLTQNGIKVEGAILNDVRVINGRYGRHGRYRYDQRRTAET